MTPSPTATPTVTPSGSAPQLCFIAIGGTSYGPWQFVGNGSRNGKTTWTNNGNYNITWSSSRNRWEILGSDNSTPFSPVGGGLFASTTTSLTIDATLDYGTALNPIKVSGLLVGDFTLVNSTTGAPITISGVTAGTGVNSNRYALAFASTPLLTALTLTVQKTGYVGIYDLTL
jgi:hypothetical protein